LKGGCIKKYLSYLKLSYIFSSIVLTIITASITYILILEVFGDVLIIPPLIEELSKLAAIIYSFHFAIIYTLVFSIIEFFYYVNMIINITGSFIIEDFLMRTFCVISHFIFLWIQIIGFKLFYKTNQKMYIIISFINAWALHVLWNGFLNGLTLSLITQLL